ncbi:MAG: hypothetical protein M3Q48_12395 [Actinomycetota bacterium]|nr:hypothetical protein [Actinomycetota bacterium]HSH23554.1 hypothetical protein [Acidimicrobiales bacterium]
MRTNTTRRYLLVLSVVAGIPLVVASVAFACQSTVTLYSNPKTVAVNSTVKVTGNKYNSSPAFGRVEIRLDRRTGPVLASATPSAGNFSTDVKIPAGTAAGYHVLIATQYNKETGVPCTGCPGRVTINVTPATSTAGAIGLPFPGDDIAVPIPPLAVLGFGFAALVALAVAGRQYRSRRTKSAAKPAA